MAAGRIINSRLAESRLFGGMIWSVAFALHEEAKHDRHPSHIVNADLAVHHAPVNADVRGLDFITVHKEDPFMNALGVKGIDEIGVTGAVAAQSTTRHGMPQENASGAFRYGSRIC